MAELRGTRRYYSIDNLCAVFSYSRQAWYNHLKRLEIDVLQEHIVLQRIVEIREKLPRTGCIKLYKELNNGFLQNLGISMGRDAIFRLVRSNGMLIRSRKRYARTTDSYHRFRIHPDLVQRRHAQRAEEIWVSDITYISTLSGFNYLSLVTDAYSRKIIIHHLSTDLKASGCIKALDKAVNNRIYPTAVLIHHSDRGTQYCCDDYVSRLKQEHILISMNQTGSPYDNAIAERVNGILKMELNLYEVFKSYKQASKAVESAVERYNNIRLHASCDYQTPENVHKKDYVNKYH
ncbi:IS3 family transposase [Pedobacter sp. Leaf176]|uniref:IS3 family transposase n=1 Tax=Pedobacter sp. Leaf176 TaxID=1736286 RepID=UPI0009EB1DDD|nr:IS3 family transposase [Pedobacter sp. Leaf176]